ncbi:MAG TPA: lysine--tRNA ligase [Methylomirabilota bacterium]|nr:lysine--tRNA ligase [Methylomirabilota bacterium]
MFWADTIAQEIKKRNVPFAWVDDMKTPSGRIHVGSLRAVTTHDIVYKALVDAGVTAKFTYVFDNHDPMDGLPTYLDKEKYEKYLGVPLFMIPSPGEGAANFAEFYAKEFQAGFNQIGCHPKIIWGRDLYLSGKMNEGIKKCLDNAAQIRTFYEDLYKKEMPSDWYPFNVYCPKCNKVSTTKVTDWDGELVTFVCRVDAVKWTKGCGYKGKISPFATKDKINGKLPWKIEWAVKWQAIGVTVEGAGKDHMTKGGSHDLAEKVAEQILKYKTPYAFAHEFFLIGGKKMSSSKGMGVSVVDLLEVLPPQAIRFLITRTRLNQAIDFDPYEKNTIPTLFDDYQKAADAYFTKTDEESARVFALSQVDEIQKPPTIRFSVLAQWVQMPNMQEKIKAEGLEEWTKYAKVYIEKYAPESEKFLVQKDLPTSAKTLSDKQKELVQKIASEIDNAKDAESFQTRIYEIGKELGLSGKETFAAIYTMLIGKDHGPKAAWLILSLDKEFVKKRFQAVSSKKDSIASLQSDKLEIGSNVFSIASEAKKRFPSLSVGVSIIKGVTIEKINPDLEKEKQEVLQSLQGLTTEQLGKYPEVISYRKLYKEMSIDWHSRRPSPEALLRRVALNKGLYTINTCVDAYNLVVMKHRVSVGAFDLNKLVFPTEVRFAKDGEEILLLGDQEPTKYTSNELAYFDQKGGFNLDFNYRDAQRTAVSIDTKNIYINVDGIYDITAEKVEEVLKEACDLIIKYCGGKIEIFGVERG